MNRIKELITRYQTLEARDYYPATMTVNTLLADMHSVLAAIQGEIDAKEKAERDARLARGQEIHKKVLVSARKMLRAISNGVIDKDVAVTVSQLEWDTLIDYLNTTAFVDKVSPLHDLRLNGIRVVAV